MIRKLFYFNKFFVHIFFDCDKVVFKDYALCITHYALCVLYPSIFKIDTYQRYGKFN